MIDIESHGHEYLTVAELADLLRIKERKVYDLASSGSLPCARATGKLLFAATDVKDWVNRSKSGGASESTTRPAIFLGSHDPLLDWAIRQSRSGIATYFDGSLDGLSRFVSREGIATGLHIREGSDWNWPVVKRAAQSENAVLIRFGKRSRGIVYRVDGAEMTSLADLAGLKIAPRQKESGSADLFAKLLADHNVDTTEIKFAQVARTEDEAVMMVKHGEADATFGLLSVAKSYGLPFLPAIEEAFDLLIDRRAWFEPGIQTFLDFCGSEAFRQRAASLGGYDVSDFGKVIWNA